MFPKPSIAQPVAEFNDFERRFKFKPRLKYGWFHLKLYQMFQDLSTALNLNLVLPDLNRGSNSLNSISGATKLERQSYLSLFWSEIYRQYNKF